MTPSEPTTIVTESWRGNREILCFEEIGAATLKLFPGSYESRWEFASIHPGNYNFVSLDKWLRYQTQNP